jgi:hypothetical protein
LNLKPGTLNLKPIERALIKGCGDEGNYKLPPSRCAPACATAKRAAETDGLPVATGDFLLLLACLLFPQQDGFLIES